VKAKQNWNMNIQPRAEFQQQFGVWDRHINRVASALDLEIFLENTDGI
jgi:hypothetical protein